MTIFDVLLGGRSKFVEFLFKPIKNIVLVRVTSCTICSPKRVILEGQINLKIRITNLECSHGPVSCTTLATGD